MQNSHAHKTMKIIHKLKQYFIQKIASTSEFKLKVIMIVMAFLAFLAINDIQNIYPDLEIELYGFVLIIVLILYGLGFNAPKFFQKRRFYLTDYIVWGVFIIFISMGSLDDSKFTIAIFGVLLISAFQIYIIQFITKIYPFSLMFTHSPYHAKNEAIYREYEKVQELINEFYPRLQIDEVSYDSKHIQFFYTYKHGAKVLEKKEKILLDKLTDIFGYATMTDVGDGPRILIPRNK